MEIYSRVRADIDLDAFEHNLNEIRRCVRPETKMIAVIKTDGYGHGAVALAKILEPRSDVWGYAVATVEEARILRNHGYQKPVLILGYTFPEQYEEIVKRDIRPAVYTYETAKLLSETAVSRDKILKDVYKRQHWINTYYRLPEERHVDKNSELVHRVKDWVDEQYEDCLLYTSPWLSGGGWIYGRFSWTCLLYTSRCV